MASSDIDIVNRALGLLGAKFITSLTEDTKEANFSNTLYADSRNAVFRAHPWNCLTKRVSLSLLSTTPAYDFDFEFQLPADFLRIVTPEDPTLIYKIEGNKLLTYEDTFKTTYIAKITTVAQYDALLIDTLAARLAHDLAMPLVQNLKTLEAMRSLYLQKLQEARSVDAMEGTPEGLEAEFYIESRTSGVNLSNDRFYHYTS